MNCIVVGSKPVPFPSFPRVLGTLAVFAYSIPARYFVLRLAWHGREEGGRGSEGRLWRDRGIYTYLYHEEISTCVSTRRPFKSRWSEHTSTRRSELVFVSVPPPEGRKSFGSFSRSASSRKPRFSRPEARKRAFPLPFPSISLSTLSRNASQSSNRTSNALVLDGSVVPQTNFEHQLAKMIVGTLTQSG